MMRKLYKKLSLTAAMLVMFTSVILAQERVISGQVTDESGGGMPGVNVLVKGTANGTASDTDGNFKISIPADDATLVFTFVGYATAEIIVGSRSVVNVQLTPDVQTLTELVVTGYTSERKQDIVAAVSIVSAKNTTAIPLSNVEQAMQGRVAGVQVITSAQPGAPSQVRIRGFGSFTSNTPLYIVDGVPTNDVSDINPNDIESTTVLKDAGAASIYGSRASSGVIVYTTKQGKRDGRVNVTYDMSVGVTMPGEGLEVLNPTQTAQKTWEALINAGSDLTHPQYGDAATPQIPDYINVGAKDADGNWKANGGVYEGDPRIQIARDNYNIDFDKGAIVQVVKANKSGTDWYDAITDPALVTRHSLGLSGGTDKSRFFVGLGYYNQQGITINQHLKRYTARINAEFNPIKQFRIGENIQIAYRDNPQIGDPQSENVLNMAYRMNPIVPIYDEYGGYAGTAAPGLNNPANPVATLNRLSHDYNQQDRLSIFGNIYAELDPIKNLTLRTSIGGTYLSGYAMQYGFRTYENSENNGSYSINEGAYYRGDYVFTNTARYDAKFGSNSLKVLVGVEAIKRPAFGRQISGFGLNPFSNDPNFIGISNTAASGRRVDSGPIGTTAALASYFTKIDYNMQDKYYLSGILRRDGSSAFGPENRYGYFPAVTAAWRMTSEGFMQSQSWLEDLKIRGGWGIMGNQNIPADNQYSLYASTPAGGYDVGGTNGSVSGGIVPLQYGNPTGKWEKNITTNIGFDAVMMDGTLDVILDVWNKKTEDLLFNPALPGTVSGSMPNIPYVNVGSIVNKGIDLQVIKRQKINSDLEIIFDGNIGFVKNEILKIKDGQEYFNVGTFRNLTFVRNQVGHSLSEFYGYKVIGLFEDAADVAASPTQDGAGPGRFKYADVTGDGVINAEDRTFIGSPIPKFTYGLNFTVNYKAFSLEAFFYGKSGNDIVNFTRWYTDFYPSFSGAAIGDRALDSWTEENTGGKTPIFENVSNTSTNGVANSYYIENGSYLRMKNLQLNYNVPVGSIPAIKSLKVYLQAVNLFTITKYEGQDPEVASSVDTTLGIDVGNYPSTKQFSIGVNLGL